MAFIGANSIKSILEVEVTGFIGGIEVGLEDQYEVWHVSKTASGNKIINSGFA